VDAGEVLAGAAGVALFAGTGFGVAELIPAVRALPAGLRCGYAYLLGVAWIAGGLYALSHGLAVPLRRPAVLALAAVPIVAGLLMRWRTRRTVREPRRAPSPPMSRQMLPPISPPMPRAAPVPRTAWPRPRLLTAATAAVAAAISLAVFCEALSNPIRDWDGRMSWAAQARYVRAAGTVDAPVLRDPRWFVTHPRYPLLLPLAQVAVLELTGSGETASPFRAAYAGFLPVFLLLVHDGARRWAGRRAAALAVLAAALVPFLAFSPEGGASTTYSDLPLACFYGAALLLLLRAPLRPLHGIAAGLLLAAAALAKQEGAPLALWALALGALPLCRRLAHPRSLAGRRRAIRRLAPLGLAALILAAALALRISWSAAIPERYDENYGSLVSLHALWPAAVTRLPLLLSCVRTKMLSFENWTIFWWVAPLVLLAGRRGLLRRIALPLSLAAAAPLAIGWAAYTLADDPVPLVMMTWNRFLLQAGVPIFLLLALALGSLLRGASTARSAARG
jgi:hypothetical protein